MNSSLELANILISGLAYYGISDVVVSPGSRNAPLVNALQSNPNFNCHSVIDERSAAFIAMGIALATEKPTAIICTSGTALLNYAPAVCEAYYQGVPLVVISADRPQQWIDQGDGQTIRQLNALGSYVCDSIQLNPPKTDEDFWLIKRKIGEAFCLPQFVSEKRPIHINCSFEEPFYDASYKFEIENRNFREPFPLSSQVSINHLQPLINKLNEAKKVLWVVGQLEVSTGKAASSLLSQIRNLPQHAILAETTSNLGSECYHTACIDRNIVSKESDFEVFQPDVLIHLGGAIVSKKIKKLLRSNQAKYSVRIHNTAFNEDTFQGLNLAIGVEAVVFLKEITSMLEPNSLSNYNELWKKHISKIDKKHSGFEYQCPWSDFYIFLCISKLLPDFWNIYWGNSSVIRYAQLFNYPQKGITHLANRGTSGIEGVSSSANGYARKSSNPTLLVTGDISFFYDINGLEAASNNLKIILINNSGGNIFRIIDGPDKMKNFDRFLETTHNKNAKHLAHHYGFHYQTATGQQDFQEELKKFLTSDKKTILEVFTPRIESPAILKDYFKTLNQE
ncbi:2-succinyl-5-enolpyruvyl-6-hydroxy-3-cyclohexene-1-carboxylic-acid synthase [Luteibaculum oceani]|nr:2-succinyl-5-enolpyruvyl-6-hydroxy-3-cyclohexene-1-carboxylic-acid synthase [Luteibaculum oceani]